MFDYWQIPTAQFWLASVLQDLSVTILTSSAICDKHMLHGYLIVLVMEKGCPPLL